MPSAFQGRKLQEREDFDNKDYGTAMQILKATVSQRVIYKWKTIESGLARWRKIWIIGSEFEKMCIQKFDTHNILFWNFFW